MKDAHDRHASKVPLCHQPRNDLIVFLRHIYKSQHWSSQTHLNAVQGFDGYQCEFANLIIHVLQESPQWVELRNDWRDHLETRGTEKHGIDPRRHNLLALDSFLRILQGKSG